VLLLAAAPASAAASGTTSGSNFTVTDGTDYTGSVGKVVEPCSANVVIFVKHAGAAIAEPADSTTYDCSAAAAGLNVSPTINWGDARGACQAE
jgi:hypothetical protein